jgi:hypothetical protein
MSLFVGTRRTVQCLNQICFTLQERKQKRHQPVRRSRRLTGAGAECGSQEDSNDEYVSYSDLEPGLDDILAGGHLSNRRTEQKTVAAACCSASAVASLWALTACTMHCPPCLQPALTDVFVFCRWWRH